MFEFNYGLAFSRNIGITNDNEQLRLKNATVAIAGMGGVGGDYLITLMRTGVSNYKISDFDEFELVNFNRQYGATISTLGRKKLDVMTELALDINPSANIKAYNSGINEDNIDDFLTGVDVFIDAIEFFQIKTHQLVLNACRERSIPAIFGVPVGYGFGVLVFTPKGMTFDDYFDIDYKAPLEVQALKMALGSAPSAFHAKYTNIESFKFNKRQAPSIACGCKLATGMVVTQAILGLLYPNELKPIPHYTCFDARRNLYKRGFLWKGNRNPLHKLKFVMARKKLGI